MTGKTLYPLVPFDMLYSIDYGTIWFIRSHMKESKYLDIAKSQTMDQKDILIALKNRNHPNPLTIIAKEGTSAESLDQLYADIMANKEYLPLIIELAPFTDFGYVIVAAGSGQMDGIIPSILIRNEFERMKLAGNDLLKDANVRYYNESCIDVRTDPLPFDPFYINSYMDLYHPDIRESFYKNILVGKNIYIADASYNETFVKGEEYLIGNEASGFGKIPPNNEFTAIDIWRKDRTDYE